MLLIKNANVYTPEKAGRKDVLIAAGKILAVENKIDSFALVDQTLDLEGAILTPGFIDQHIHTNGAGGKHGFSSMTPEIKLSDLVRCGSTTVVGLLGTDGSIRSIQALYGKTRSLEKEGLSAYMYTGYFGVDGAFITGNVRDDMIFVDKVLGCKIAIGDVRSSYPTALELARILREIRVAGMMTGKKGILHIHLGVQAEAMDVLFELLNNYHFPIEHISPTHVGRTEELFARAIEFARLGGMIDITTGASKYAEPYQIVLDGLEAGISLDQMTFSTDGNAGLDRLDENGKRNGFRSAPVDTNFLEMRRLVNEGGIPLEKALRLITTNPAKNLGLSTKGSIQPGSDADLCCLDDQLNLVHLVAKGKLMMTDGEIIRKGNFE
jgi:beta-aspartyl-dipeptidase (metallo-type)